nr:hypothetical protein [Tanacetum cinerariifolium]
MVEKYPVIYLTGENGEKYTAGKLKRGSKITKLGGLSGRGRFDGENQTRSGDNLSPITMTMPDEVEAVRNEAMVLSGGIIGLVCSVDGNECSGLGTYGNKVGGRGSEVF